MLDYSQLQDQLETVRHRVSEAEKKAGRTAGTVKLIGASKKQAIEKLRWFVEQGLCDLGENYLQESLDKQNELSQLPISWHFIGAIQSNKTAQIARHFDWVHSVDRPKIARRLAEQFVPCEHRPTLNTLLQLNLEGEASKAGIAASEVLPTLEALKAYPAISCRGFMLIPAPHESELAQRTVFAQARELLQSSNAALGMNMDSLSMGMSNDLDAAIAEGSTMVRIGTDLFGARD